MTPWSSTIVNKQYVNLMSDSPAKTDVYSGVSGVFRNDHALSVNITDWKNGYRTKGCRLWWSDHRREKARASIKGKARIF
jgi:hypothetical protein